MTDFYAYISTSGKLIVQKDPGLSGRQETRRVVRREIAVFPAQNIEHARQIARTINGDIK